MKASEFYQKKIKDIKGKIPLFRKRTLLRFAEDYAKERIRLLEIDTQVKIKSLTTRIKQLEKLKKNEKKNK